MFIIGSLATQAVRAVKLIPSNVVNEVNLNDATFNDIFNFYRGDMPSPSSFFQELNLWQRLWTNAVEKPDTIETTLSNSKTCTVMYPNITKVLYLLLLTSVTSSSVERAFLFEVYQESSQKYYGRGQVQCVVASLCP